MGKLLKKLGQMIANIIVVNTTVLMAERVVLVLPLVQIVQPLL
jgi:hypothetical protein